MDRYIGKRLGGRYEILEIIGIGGMANVYKARDLIEDRPVAVKILKEEFVSNEEFVRRFKNESKAIAALSHPNIVRVYDVLLSESIPAIVMEHIDGITLKEYIEREGVLKWKEAIYYIVQILRALQHAHDKGIVHRDIKPQNIMLLADGTIKVMDFGIARFARLDSKTITDKVIGSVHYISPEQACGDLTDQKTDIYSVGVMFFEMLTGRLPFDGDGAVNVALMQVSKEPIRPRELNETIPEGLEEIIIRAMQKNPSQRYQTAAEMLRDIEEFKKNPSIQFEYKYFVDENPTRFYQTVSPAAKTAEAAAVAQAEDEEEDEKKGKLLPIIAGITAAFVVVLVTFGIIVFFLMTGNNLQDVDVPYLIGESFEDVQFAYPDFKITVANREYNDEYAEGMIVSQTPEAGGAKKKSGTTIEVVVSRGPQLVTVPDVYGDDYETGVRKLENAGFETVEGIDFDSSVPTGAIIRTDPAHLSNVKKGTTIRVIWNKGAPVVKTIVPEVDGISSADAQKALELKNLKFKIVEENSSLEKGTVIRSDPKQGEEIAEGETVILYVSTGEVDQVTKTIEIPLPNFIDQLTELTIYKNGLLVETQKLNPSIAVTYNARVKGSGANNRITVRLDGKPYLQYVYDFDTETLILTEDLTDNFRPATSSDSSAPSEDVSSEPSGEQGGDTSSVVSVPAQEVVVP